jgi:hypothetical protein
LKAEKKKKKILAPLLIITHNLSHLVNFATGIQNNSSNAIYNIYLDKSIINLSSIPPIINGLSDHEALILTIRNIYATISRFSSMEGTRLRDKKKS